MLTFLKQFLILNCFPLISKYCTNVLMVTFYYVLPEQITTFFRLNNSKTKQTVNYRKTKINFIQSLSFNCEI